MATEPVRLLFLRYTGTEQDAGPFVAGHVEYLDRHHGAEVFVLSGQTDPAGIGGMILAVGVDREQVEAITAQDPFVIGGVGRYEIMTVAPGRVHPALAGLTGADPVRGAARTGPLRARYFSPRRILPSVER
jgi:uncharacterized protein YciI